MAFMKPQYTNEPFFTGETWHGETVVCPADVYGTRERFAEETEAMLSTVERIEGSWWCRLSAPGYLDATDWSGPFDTRDAAEDEIERTYDVHAETGEELPDEDTGPE